MPSGIDEIKGTVLTFDFVISELEKYYSKTSPKNAYKEIKEYLVKNGFEHLKDSDYRHLEFSIEETYALVCDFSNSNKWFTPCLGKLNLSPNIPIVDVSLDLKNVYNDVDWMNRKVAEYYGLEEELKEDDELEL